ncbi:hypothetical protein, partial [Vibrio anguillarum]|uniref:hypothetical protein n=1 Tax=Vibrio anguillarum TaxID=55601 RepID=UPI001BE48822
VFKPFVSKAFDCHSTPLKIKKISLRKVIYILCLINCYQNTYQAIEFIYSLRDFSHRVVICNQSNVTRNVARVNEVIICKPLSK